MSSKFPKLGETATVEVCLDEAKIRAFVAYSGDTNPLHLNHDYARERGFDGAVAHGMAYASLLSTLIGTKLPGTGALWSSQSIRFTAPVHVGETVRIRGTVIASDSASRRLRLRVEADVPANGRQVMEGESEIIVPGTRGAKPADADKQPSLANRNVEQDARGAVLVLGASGSLGNVIARKFSEAGRRVWAVGRSLDRLEERLAGVDGVESVAFDITDPAATATGLARILDDGFVETVIHAASEALDDAMLETIGSDALARHIAVQAIGFQNLAAATLPEMRRRKRGQFIYVGSTALRGPPPKKLAAYTAAKSAGASLARSIAHENAAHGIRSNIVSPHFLETDLQSHITDKSRRLVAAQIPARRFATLEEVATAVHFLSEPTSAYINGHDLLIDGGVSMV